MAGDEDGRAPGPARGSWQPISPGLVGMGVPLREPARSTPLDDGEEGEIPAAVLWAMKYHRHVHFGDRTEENLRSTLGEGDAEVHVIDDGPDRCMIGRMVGTGTDGCTYCLVGSIDVGTYWRFADGDDPVTEIFADARHLLLCAVYAKLDAVSNVVEVAHYRRLRDVPVEYFPGQALIAFSDEE